MTPDDRATGSTKAMSWENCFRHILVDLMWIKVMLVLVIAGETALLLKAFA